jgi:hypothetical protein
MRLLGVQRKTVFAYPYTNHIEASRRRRASPVSTAMTGAPIA